MMRLQNLRECMIVLVQHNLVHTYVSKLEKSGQKLYLYEANLEQILMRLRHPKFLLHVGETLGDNAESVLQALLENGRLRLSQILSSVATKSEVAETVIAGKLQAAFLALLDARYIERAPDCEQEVPPCKEPYGLRRNRPGKGMPGSNWKQKSTGEISTEEAEGEDNRRFQIPDIFVLKKEKDNIPVLRAKRRKLARITDEEDLGSPSISPWDEGDSNKVLWRVNAIAFNQVFRHKLCIDAVSEVFGERAGSVAEAMIHLSLQEERKLRVESTALSSAEAIVGACLEQRIEPRFSSSEVLALLDSMSMDSCGFLTRYSINVDALSYTLNLSKIMDRLRLKHVEAVVLQKFGDRACRIFRLLLQKRMLEQKQIADAAMLSVKDARELLYQMMKEEFVSIQEVPRSSDHAPARTFYLFYIDLPVVLKNVTAQLYEALSSIRARLEFELRQEEDVLGLLDAVADRENEEGGLCPSVVLTVSQRQQVEQVRKIAMLLETLMGRLDDMIALFDNY